MVRARAAAGAPVRTGLPLNGFDGGGSFWQLIAANVVDGEVRYVLASDFPALTLRGGWRGMWTFLVHFGFGEEGRVMSVRLVDSDGRLAWVATFDGDYMASVRTRPELAGCGPPLELLRYGIGVLRVPYIADPPRCPLETKRPVRDTASTASILR